jgi:hypothetical protein
MTSDILKQILEELKGSGATLKCEGMRRYLECLGFDVRDGKKEGHKIVTHKGLPSFYSTSYTCGHGKNPEIKPQYVQSIRKTLVQHEEELKEYLKEQQE